MNTDDGDLRRLFGTTMTEEQQREFMKKATEVPARLQQMADEALGDSEQVTVPDKHPLRISMKKWRKHVEKRSRIKKP